MKPFNPFSQILKLICAFSLTISVSGLAQDLVWAKRAGGSSFDIGRAIAVDGSGNSYVTGSFDGVATFGAGEANETTLSGSSEIFVAKYNSSGELVWAKRAGGSSGDDGLGIAVDGSGNSYVTGSFDGSATFGTGEANETTLSGSGIEIFLAKYNSSGELVWAKRAGGSGTAFGFGIAVDELGNSYVTGFFEGSATFGAGEANETTLSGTGREIFLAKYNSGGELVWAKRAGGLNSDVGRGIAVDGSGNSYVTGEFDDSATFGTGEANETTLSGSSRIFVAKYDPSGALMWAKRAGGSSGGGDVGNGIAVDRSGNSYVTGTFRDFAIFGTGEANETFLLGSYFEVFVAKYNPGGELVWAKRAGGPAGAFDDGLGVAVDGSGNTYVTGTFQGFATFGAGEDNETTLVSSSDPEVGVEIFVAKYNPRGKLIWAKDAGGSGSDVGLGIAVDGSGNSYVTGYFVGSAIFGAGEANATTVAGSDYEIFVAKYGGPAPANAFVLLADQNLSISKQVFSEGDIHSNNNVMFGAGNPSVHNGNVMAVGDIKIATKNVINGDVTAGGSLTIAAGATVNGNIAQNASVTPVPLPTLSFSAGGVDRTVLENRSLSLPPGSYGVVKVKRAGALFLSHDGSTGDYFFERLELTTPSRLIITVIDGPVNINVVNSLIFGKKTEVAILPSGESDSDLVTFRSLQSNLKVGADAKVLGTLIAPNALVTFAEKARFKGAVVAKSIVVGRLAIILHHSSTGGLPKASPVDDLADEEESVYSEQLTPTSYELEQNYPNPFNAESTIEYALPWEAMVRLRIYNTFGQLVRTLVDETQPTGRYRIIWNGRDNASREVGTGVYLLRLEAGSQTFMRKMTMVK